MSFALLAWLACLLAWLAWLARLAWLAWLSWIACLLVCLVACLPGLFGPFVALAVRGPGVPDRGEMEKEKEEKKWADLKLKSNNPTLNGGEHRNTYINTSSRSYLELFLLISAI